METCDVFNVNANVELYLITVTKIVTFVKTAQNRLRKDFNATKQSKRLQEILLGNSRPNNYDFR